MPARSAFRRLVLATALSLAQLTTSFAYQQTLEPAAVHEAYVLGQRNDAATAAFLSAYLKEFTTESQGTVRVTQIEVLTPFTQVVDRSRRNTSGYTEQQAREDYAKHPNTVSFNVSLMLPAAYAAATNDPASATENSQTPDQNPEDFWRRLVFRVKQGDKLPPTRAISSEPIFSSATPNQPAVLDGANVWLEYDAKDIASTDTTVEVVTPEGGTMSASFDLKKLR